MKQQVSALVMKNSPTRDDTVVPGEPYRHSRASLLLSNQLPHRGTHERFSGVVARLGDRAPRRTGSEGADEAVAPERRLRRRLTGATPPLRPRGGAGRRVREG